MILCNLTASLNKQNTPVGAQRKPKEAHGERVIKIHTWCRRYPTICVGSSEDHQTGAALRLKGCSLWVFSFFSGARTKWFNSLQLSPQWLLLALRCKLKLGLVRYRTERTSVRIRVWTEILFVAGSAGWLDVICSSKVRSVYALAREKMRRCH